MTRWFASLFLLSGLSLSFAACGARSGLPGMDGEGGGQSNGGGGAAPVPCVDGTTEPCGSDVGECKKGVHVCTAGVFGPCEGEVPPKNEACNGLDDDCDGEIDNGFHLGEACDGPDADQCADDVMTCNGCTLGDDNPETCNGVDDNCNGIIDADCTVGDCQPTLLVVGSTPSSPNCVDFPVEAGSTGVIEYPCGGGNVTAQLGEVSFTGSVTNGVVDLHGVNDVIGPDGCTWETDHHIFGNIPDGVLNYGYEEAVIFGPIGVLCWSPCTETGTVNVQWVPEGD